MNKNIGKINNIGTLVKLTTQSTYIALNKYMYNNDNNNNKWKYYLIFSVMIPKLNQPNILPTNLLSKYIKLL